MKRLAVLLPAMILSAGCFHSVGAADWDFFYGSSYYEFIISDCTWSEAFQYAQYEGGHLVCFETPDEYQAVVNQIQNMGMQWKIFWIGARRDFDSDEYYWVDADNDLVGDCLNSYYNWACSAWMSGEPSFEDAGIPEWCVDMFYYSNEGRWVFNDTPNDIISVVPSYSGKVGYIIEYENDPYGWGDPYGRGWYYGDDGYYEDYDWNYGDDWYYEDHDWNYGSDWYYDSDDDEWYYR